MSDREYFTLKGALGNQDDARYYIRSFDDIFYKYLRNVALPNISYISILKLKDANGVFFFLFRLSLSYSFNPYYHPAKARQATEEIKQKRLPERVKMQLVRARVGQGLYRVKLLEESSECIITRVSDERVLIASHIKPWIISNDIEKVDYNNGLLLTPTYDKLFDQGFISFEGDGTIIISPYISPLNIKKLNLSDGKRFIIPESEKRKEYLTYHRANIFKK